MTFHYDINTNKPHDIKIYDGDVLIVKQPWYPNQEEFSSYDEARAWAIMQIEHISDPYNVPMPPVAPNAERIFNRPEEQDLSGVDPNRELIDTNGIDTTSDYLEQIGFFKP